MDNAPITAATTASGTHGHHLHPSLLRSWFAATPLTNDSTPATATHSQRQRPK
jgi:hypothetical protein